MSTRHKKLIFRILFIISLILTCPLFASIKILSSKENKALKWQVVDIPFKASLQEGQDPFQVDFSAVFTGPENTMLTIPGFYNGQDVWIVRFSASVPGEWRYQTTSPIKALNHKEGRLVVLDEASPGQHGGIVINPKNPQRFVYEDGSPYFLLAYECDWLYALDYHNDKAAPKTEHFLSLLAGNGCTHLVMNAYTFDVSWPKDKRLLKYPEHDVGGSQDIFPFRCNNEKPDFTALNPDYFKKLDRTISLMNERGIVSHLMIYVWNKRVNWPPMYSDADNMYFDYVIKRYQAFSNIVFDISKEALAYGRADDQYILERIERARKLNAFNRLVTVHDFAFCQRHPQTVDFISMQSWSSTLYTLTLNTVNQYSDKPVLNIEHGGYEESPYVVWTGVFTDPEVCLRRNYMVIFGGGYSAYYWQGCSWNVLIYNPFEQPEDFIKPKFEYYKHLTRFFTKHEFDKLKPDPEHNRSAYCLTDGQGKYIFYVPKENYMIQPNFLTKSADKRTFTWFNTLTGETIPHQSALTEEDGTGIISAWQGDIHLPSPWRGEADAILVSEILE